MFLQSIADAVENAAQAKLAIPLALQAVADAKLALARAEHEALLTVVLAREAEASLLRTLRHEFGPLPSAKTVLTLATARYTQDSVRI
jgi:hypothetical protein